MIPNQVPATDQEQETVQIPSVQLVEVVQSNGT